MKPFSLSARDDEIVPVVEPYLEKQDEHEIPCVDKAEHGHGRGDAGGEEHLEPPLRMAEMDHEGQGRHDEERKGGEKGEPVGRLHFPHFEDLHEGGKDESTCHEARDVRVDHDEEVPVQLDLVGIDVADDLLEEGVEARIDVIHATSPPCRDRRRKPWARC